MLSHSLFLILPLLAATITLGAPLRSNSLDSHNAEEASHPDIEPRQRRPGAGRGSRPAHTRRPKGSATQAAASTVVPASVGTPAPAPAPVPAPASTPTAELPAEPVGSASAGGSSASLPAPAPAASGAETGTGGTSSSSGGNGGGGGGGGPVGLGWDPLKNPASMDSYVEAGLQWWTNWSPSAPAYPAVEFVPMVWGAGSVDLLKDAMGNWPSGTKYVLSLNEPDQQGTVGGSATSAAAAVTAHNAAAAILGDGYSLSAPAVARGGGPWLDEWLAACDAAGGCKHDFIAYHYYGTDANDLIQYTKDFYAKYKKPLWLTEWACHDFGGAKCDVAQTKVFMKTAIEWFRGEGSSMVQRWAWFGAFPDMTNWNGANMDANRIAKADGTINDLGIEYLSL